MQHSPRAPNPHGCTPVRAFVAEARDMVGTERGLCGSGWHCMHCTVGPAWPTQTAECIGVSGWLTGTVFVPPVVHRSGCNQTMAEHMETTAVVVEEPVVRLVPDMKSTSYSNLIRIGRCRAQRSTTLARSDHHHDAFVFLSISLSLVTRERSQLVAHDARNMGQAGSGCHNQT